jgi:hypothetical protein
VDPAPFVRATEDGATLDVFVQPRAATEGIVGIHGRSLKVKVTAPPLEDRANKAVEKLIARALGIARSNVSVVAGSKSRSKQIAVRGMGARAVQEAIGHVLRSRAHDSG